MYDVVIVGAGVAGLAAAVAAGRMGYGKVLLIDQHRHLPELPKGEFLQPRTLDILDTWGLVDALESQRALQIEALECKDAQGNFLGAFDYRLLPHRFNYGLVHYYARIRGDLFAEAQRFAEIRLGTRVTSVLSDVDERVRGVAVRAENGEERVPARLVVGADGPNSTVRKKMAIPSDRVPYDHAFLAFDLYAPHLGPRIINFLTRQGARIVYPMPHGRARLYVQVQRGQVAATRRLAPLEQRRRLLASCSGLTQLLNGTPLNDLAAPWSFGAWRAMTRRWTWPGLVFIGDAAHSVHPMAGQGMNASIVDGWTLFHVMAIMKGLDSDARLDAAIAKYESIRAPEVRKVGHVSNRLSQLCTVTSPAALQLVRWMLRRNRRNHRLQIEATTRLAGLESERFTTREWLQILTGV